VKRPASRNWAGLFLSLGDFFDNFRDVGAPESSLHFWTTVPILGSTRDQKRSNI
jgi:hypothetical protein